MEDAGEPRHFEGEIVGLHEDSAIVLPLEDLSLRESLDLRRTVVDREGIDAITAREERCTSGTLVAVARRTDSSPSEECPALAMAAASPARSGIAAREEGSS
jgi:hypothetical protein